MSWTVVAVEGHVRRSFLVVGMVLVLVLKVRLLRLGRDPGLARPL